MSICVYTLYVCDCNLVSKLESFSYSNKQNQRKTLKFLSFNVWFNEYNWDIRIKEILKIVEAKNPDVICFQEITKDFFKMILNTDNIKEKYYITAAPYEMRNWYDIIILSKYKCKSYTFPFMSKMNRKLLYITIIYNKKLIRIGTVHLESMNNMYKRDNQLSESYRILLGIDKSLPFEISHAFLIGDFNFSEKENKFIRLFGFIDPVEKYLEKEKIDKYFTMKSMKGYPPWRPDRFTYKSNTNSFNIKSFEVIGKEPIFKETFFNPVGTPSDHYGLFIEVEL
jgi:tyrosyl-DNA phosphodiesterase 2